MKIGVSEAFVAPENATGVSGWKQKLERSHPRRQSNIFIIIIYNWSLGAGISLICLCHTYYWYWVGFYFTLFFPPTWRVRRVNCRVMWVLASWRPSNFPVSKVPALQIDFNHGNYVFRRQTFHTGSNFVFGMIKVASVKAAGSLQMPREMSTKAFVAARS